MMASLFDRRARELEQPLSLLMLHVPTVEFLNHYGKWFRRVVVFAADKMSSYQLVASALDMDLYNKHNFKIRSVAVEEILQCYDVAWPFDVLCFHVDENTWTNLWRKVENWGLILQEQLKSEGASFLLLQGEKRYMDKAVEYLIESVDVSIEPLALSADLTDWEHGAWSLSMWRIRNRGRIPEVQRTIEEDDHITDLMLWGEMVE